MAYTDYKDVLHRYLDTIKGCKNCGRNGQEWFVDHSDLHIKECGSCGFLHGVDDTSSMDDIMSSLKSLKVNMCACGNSDVNAYIIGDDSLSCTACSCRIPFTTAGESTDEFKLVCVGCKNEKQDKFKIYTEGERFMGVECLSCKTQLPFHSEDDFSERFSVRLRRERITKAEMLQDGDHVAFWRPESYWHHALVERVFPEVNSIDVVHYNGPSPGGYKVKGKVVEETLDLSKEKGHLFRINYINQNIFDPLTAIVRARSRLGEEMYNFLTNNCEHFVRWCKTGAEVCTQAHNVLKRGRRILRDLTRTISTTELAKGFIWIAQKTVVSGVVSEGVTEVAGGLLPGYCKQICERLGLMSIATVEVTRLFVNVWTALRERLDGQISRDEFRYVVVRSVFDSVVGGGATMAGAALGELLLPIPILNGLVGASIGAALGHMLAYLLGHFITYEMEYEKRHGKG